MTTYDVYTDGKSKQFSIDPNASLAEAREQISNGGMMGSPNQYQFVYYNPMTEQQTIMNQPQQEPKIKVSKVAFAPAKSGGNQIIKVANVGSARPDLFGTRVDWLYDRHTGVRVNLNMDDVGRPLNAGKFEPLMLSDVQPTNPNSNFFASNAVICEKGSIISFSISSWGAAGFGFRVQSNKERIVDALYISYGDDPNRQSYAGASRYQSSANTIQVDSTEKLKISKDLIIDYQKITVKTWRMTGYDQGGKHYSSNMQAPQLATGAGGGFDPGPPGGDTYVPGQSIQTGAPHRGPKSNVKFGSISNISQDDPDNTVLGAVVLYFFVFRDRNAANEVMNILNSPNPTPYAD